MRTIDLEQGGNVSFEKEMPRQRQRKKIFAKVLIFNKDDNQIRQHSVNVNNQRNHVWIINLMKWAIDNGFSIEIDPMRGE